MQTVGQILQATRIAKNIVLEDVEKKIKIRLKFLQAIENDDYTLLPSSIYSRGFIKNYATFLRLDVNKILALYRRQVDEQARYKAPPKELKEPLSYSLLHPTPNKVIGVVVVLSLLVLGSYFFSQYQRLFEPPSLTVEQPQQNAVVSQESMVVFGSTDPDTTVVINNATVLVQEDGKFFKEIQLEQGQNTITIEAISRRGKKATIQRTVTVVLSGG